MVFLSLPFIHTYVHTYIQRPIPAAKRIMAPTEKIDEEELLGYLFQKKKKKTDLGKGRVVKYRR